MQGQVCIHVVILFMMYLLQNAPMYFTYSIFVQVYVMDVMFGHIYC